MPHATFESHRSESRDLVPQHVGSTPAAGQRSPALTHLGKPGEQRPPNHQSGMPIGARRSRRLATRLTRAPWSWRGRVPAVADSASVKSRLGWRAPIPIGNGTCPGMRRAITPNRSRQVPVNTTVLTGPGLTRRGLFNKPVQISNRRRRARPESRRWRVGHQLQFPMVTRRTAKRSPL